MSPNDTSPVDELKPVATPKLGTSDRNGASIESAAAQIQSDSPYVKELQRNIRSVTKKLGAMQKIDSIIAENPSLSLDELVAARKINNDQKAQALKKPALQASLAQYDQQITQYKKFEKEFQDKAATELSEVRAAHEKELETMRTSHEAETQGLSKTDLKRSLLVLSKFLRAAAARRQMDDEESAESKAFEGVLLLLYGGDTSAVEAAEKLIEGSSEEVPSTEGTMLQLTYEKVKSLSLEYAPFAAEEAWVNGVAQAEAGNDVGAAAAAEATEAPSDPTIAHAGLTELEDVAADQTATANTEAAEHASNQGTIDEGAANEAAREQWDTTKTQATGDPLSESWVSVPRDPAETENQHVGAAPGTTQNWADDVPSDPVSINVDATTPQANGGDEFHEVRGRGGRGRGGGHHDHRGRGRGRGGMRGEGRGRGGGHRGEHRGEGGHRGEHRSEGGQRGERGEGGARGERADGGHRGGRGRGRGGRGRGEAV